LRLNLSSLLKSFLSLKILLSLKLSLPQDPFFRLLVIQGLAGLGLAIAFLAGILLLDIGRLRSLIFAAPTGLLAPDGLLALGLLGAGLIITLVSVVIGGAIMMISDMPDQEPPKTRPPAPGKLAFRAVRIDPHRRRD
jgi:uncharacterized BrkB/YihY/UPF0761 family membrane protein